MQCFLSTGKPFSIFTATTSLVDICRFSSFIWLESDFGSSIALYTSPKVPSPKGSFLSSLTSSLFNSQLSLTWITNRLNHYSLLEMCSIFTGVIIQWFRIVEFPLSLHWQRNIYKINFSKVATLKVNYSLVLQAMVHSVCGHNIFYKSRMQLSWVQVTLLWLPLPQWFHISQGWCLLYLVG